MEKIKDPAMLLSMTNSVGLVGITAYFYKQLEAQRNDMNKISQALGQVVKKLSEMEKGEQNRSEALHGLNDQIKQINDQIEDLPSFETLSDIDLDLSEIVSALDEANIIVERPSQLSGIRNQKRSNNKNNDYRSARQPIDERREINSRKNTKSSDRHRSAFATTETSREQEVRQPIRQLRDNRSDRGLGDTRDSRDTRMSRPESRQEPRADSLLQDEESELIGEVRRQARS